VADDAIHHGIIGEESDDLRRAAAMRADHRINFIDFADHLGPALGGDGPELLLHNPESKRPEASLFDLPPVGVGVDAEVAAPSPLLPRSPGNGGGGGDLSGFRRSGWPR